MTPFTVIGLPTGTCHQIVIKIIYTAIFSAIDAIRLWSDPKEPIDFESRLVHFGSNVVEMKMDEVGSIDVSLGESLASAEADNVNTSQRLESILSGMRKLLVELDGLGLPRAATYLSMAIDQIEADFTTKSK